MADISQNQNPFSNTAGGSQQQSYGQSQATPGVTSQAPNYVYGLVYGTPGNSPPAISPQDLYTGNLTQTQMNYMNAIQSGGIGFSSPPAPQQSEQVGTVVNPIGGTIEQNIAAEQNPGVMQSATGTSVFHYGMAGDVVQQTTQYQAPYIPPSNISPAQQQFMMHAEGYQANPFNPGSMIYTDTRHPFYAYSEGRVMYNALPDIGKSVANVFTLASGELNTIIKDTIRGEQRPWAEYAGIYIESAKGGPLGYVAHVSEGNVGIMAAEVLTGSYFLMPALAVLSTSSIGAAAVEIGGTGLLIGGTSYAGLNAIYQAKMGVPASDIAFDIAANVGVTLAGVKGMQMGSNLAVWEKMPTSVKFGTDAEQNINPATGVATGSGTGKAYVMSEERLMFMGRPLVERSVYENPIGEFAFATPSGKITMGVESGESLYITQTKYPIFGGYTTESGGQVISMSGFKGLTMNEMSGSEAGSNIMARSVSTGVALSGTDIWFSTRAFSGTMTPFGKPVELARWKNEAGQDIQRVEYKYGVSGNVYDVKTQEFAAFSKEWNVPMETTTVTERVNPIQYAQHLQEQGKIQFNVVDVIGSGLEGRYGLAGGKPTIEVARYVRNEQGFTKPLTLEQQNLAVSHELVHYNTPKWFLDASRKLPYEYRPSEMLAYNLQNSKVTYPITRKITAEISPSGHATGALRVTSTEPVLSSVSGGSPPVSQAPKMDFDFGGATAFASPLNSNFQGVKLGISSPWSSFYPKQRQKTMVETVYNVYPQGVQNEVTASVPRLSISTSQSQSLSTSQGMSSMTAQPQMTSQGSQTITAQRSELNVVPVQTTGQVSLQRQAQQTPQVTSQVTTTRLITPNVPTSRIIREPPIETPFTRRGLRFNPMRGGNMFDFSPRKRGKTRQSLMPRAGLFSLGVEMGRNVSRGDWNAPKNPPRTKATKRKFGLELRRNPIGIEFPTAGQMGRGERTSFMTGNINLGNLSLGKNPFKIKGRRNLL